jgi:hypothetical protein
VTIQRKAFFLTFLYVRLRMFSPHSGGGSAGLQRGARAVVIGYRRSAIFDSGGLVWQKSRDIAEHA